MPGQSNFTPQLRLYRRATDVAGSGTLLLWQRRHPSCKRQRLSCRGHAPAEQNLRPGGHGATFRDNRHETRKKSKASPLEVHKRLSLSEGCCAQSQSNAAVEAVFPLLRHLVELQVAHPELSRTRLVTVLGHAPHVA